jgi:hypothetical protein
MFSNSNDKKLGYVNLEARKSVEDCFRNPGVLFLNPVIIKQTLS